MIMWLSRRTNGQYLLSKKRPVCTVVQGTSQQDLYLSPGDPVGVQHLCERGVTAVFSVCLEPLQSVQVRLDGCVIKKAE